MVCDQLCEDNCDQVYVRANVTKYECKCDQIREGECDQLCEGECDQLCEGECDELCEAECDQLCEGNVTSYVRGM